MSKNDRYSKIDYPNVPMAIIDAAREYLPVMKAHGPATSAVVLDPDEHGISHLQFPLVITFYKDPAGQGWAFLRSHYEVQTTNESVAPRRKAKDIKPKLEMTKEAAEFIMKWNAENPNEQVDVHALPATGKLTVGIVRAFIKDRRSAVQ